MSKAQGAAQPHHPAGPHLALLHAAMLLSGFGTVFLGPALPALAASSHASDSGSGLFFTAQFAGAFLGGITTSQRLWLCLLRGLAAATIGFAALAFCARAHAAVPWDLAALAVVGFGVGQMLTTINLLTSRRSQHERSSALALVNFSWSLGAVTAPFLIGVALSAVTLPPVLAVAAVVFLLILLAAAWNAAGHREQEDAAAQATVSTLPAASFLAFAAMLLVYGGVETCLSGWITTFAARYGAATLQTASLGTTALWIGITAGRALTPLLLRVFRERLLLIGALALSAAAVIALSRTSSNTGIVVLAGFLGLCLAPWFPLVLSSMLSGGASARQTGTIIALSGIGAAVLPALLGAVSNASGSLRIALTVPVAGLLVLIVLAMISARQPAAKSV